jgi:hypothetical protein
MRFAVKATIPHEAGNALITSGQLAPTIQKILGDLRPECAYFSTDAGVRSVFMVVDIQDASKIPSIAEPFFLAFGAAVDIHPVMVAEDLMKAGPDLEAAAKTWGSRQLARAGA